MVVLTPTPVVGVPGGTHNRESTHSAVSWPAVFAGAVVASVVTVMLLALGSGIGLASVSPFSNANPSVAGFTLGAAIWMIVVQWLSSGLGGYLTGRMRTKWSDLHTDEVFFRDTANGFIAWALASLIVVGFASSAITSVVGGVGRAGGMAAAGAAGGAAHGASMADRPADALLDVLFRPTQPNAAESSTDAKAEAGRILATGLTGTVSPEDHAYLAQMVAARTGLSQDDADKRVDDVIAKEKAAADKAKQAANAARKATSKLMFYTFFSMLIGAFIACAAAALGGRERDQF